MKLIDPPILKGILLACILSIAMLSWPLLGEPPYAYYSVMKVVVAGSSFAGAWAVYQHRPWLLPLSFLLAGTGLVELLGKMQREQWVPINQASIVLLLVTGVVCTLNLKASSSRSSRQNMKGT